MSDDDLAELASYVLQTDNKDKDDSERMLLESIPPRLLFDFKPAQASAEDDSERMLLESCYSSSSARWPPPREEGAGVRVSPRATASGRAPVLGEDKCGGAASQTKRLEEEEVAGYD